VSGDFEDCEDFTKPTGHIVTNCKVGIVTYGFSVLNLPGRPFVAVPEEVEHQKWASESKILNDREVDVLHQLPLLAATEGRSPKRKDAGTSATMVGAGLGTRLLS